MPTSGPWPGRSQDDSSSDPIQATPSQVFTTLLSSYRDNNLE